MPRIHPFRWLLPLPLGWHLFPIVALMGVYAFGVYEVSRWPRLKAFDWGAGGSVVSGIVLGLLLVMHSNTANMRWWEGRSLWGSLVNNSRNLALKVRQLVTTDDADRQYVARQLIGFADSLRLHLREGTQLQRVPSFENEAESPRHVPLFFANRVYETIGRWKASGAIDSNTVRVLDENAKALMDVCGACEKIRFTPLPLSFRALLRHGIVIYLAVAPWQLVPEFGVWGILAVVVVTYFLVGTELLAEDVEEPFGIGPDNLDLDAYCATIERSVREVLG